MTTQRSPRGFELAAGLEEHLRWLLDPETMDVPDPAKCLGCQGLMDAGLIVRGDSGAWMVLDPWELL